MSKLRHGLKEQVVLGTTARESVTEFNVTALSSILVGEQYERLEAGRL